MAANASFPNLVDVEEVLCRLARDTHGALSLLGSTSLECWGGSDIARERVSDRRDGWRAYVLDVRQLLLAADEGQPMENMLDHLLQAVDRLAAAYTGLVDADALPPDAVAELRGEFPAAYRELQSALGELGSALGIDLSFPSRLNSLRRTCFERSLKWLDDELSKYSKAGSGAE
jgi:hypothetical protein